MDRPHVPRAVREPRHDEIIAARLELADRPGPDLRLGDGEPLRAAALPFDHSLRGHVPPVAVDRALNGEDALVVMPTGSGKSIVYQLPALLLHGLTVVVSPLIALMKDQQDKLSACGVEALAMHSHLNTSEARETA